MKLYFCLLLFSLTLVSCKGKTADNTVPAEQKNDTLIALKKIQELDSSLFLAYKEMGDTASTIPVDLIEKTIQAHKDFVFNYPKHEFTPEALDKIHQLYMQLGQYKFSVDYGQQIIDNYPGYSKINQVLYSVATSYDFMLDDKEKAMGYYKTLISKEKVPAAIKNEIKDRLKVIETK
ncbi:MAG: hypothetical protein J0G96_10480 [Flavobacteriia bacterium]|nr:hypothetical protein [Flavobacteriia bacterium]OJX34806.1 MAG: hypothetical protein BGO87_08640 [Flavobacteriia bacterium 40-80]